MFAAMFFLKKFKRMSTVRAYTMRFFYVVSALQDARFAKFRRDCADDARFTEVHEALIMAVAVYDTEKGFDHLLVVADTILSSLPKEA